MNPPEIPGWNLALRLGLELVSLVALAAAAWQLSSGALRWVAVMVVPLVAAAVWGVFNVIDDPSRSGEAPVEVPGAVRLIIELGVLGAGAVALGVAWHPVVGVVFAIVILFHYVTTFVRVRWLLQA